MIDNSGGWMAVECGVDEWFLAKPEPGQESGYDPYIDLGGVPRDLAHRIAACLNFMAGVPTEDIERMGRYLPETAQWASYWSNKR